MRILLAHNSTYYPSAGGGDKSNRLLMEALAARGHSVRVVTRVEAFGEESHNRLTGELRERGIEPDRPHGPGLRFHLGGVDVRVLTRNAHLRAFFAAHVHAFDPDIILTSTDDPGQLMLDIALHAPRARVVYLIRATVAAPFGPESAAPAPAKTAVLRQVDGAVGVSRYVAEYVRRWAGIDAVYAPISLLPPGDPPCLGSFDNEFVLMVNPCAVKGISIFLALADRLPAQRFAAVPGWGTTPGDLEQLEARANVSVLPPADDFDQILRHCRVAVVPSIWAEARSRVILEALSRGIPVLASDVGGLAEAMLGVPHLLPVNPVSGYRTGLDSTMVPQAAIPPQDVDPWLRALAPLLTERAAYEELAGRSRKAALEFLHELTVEPFERYLESILRSERRRPAPVASPRTPLSPDKRRLLAARLKKGLE